LTSASTKRSASENSQQNTFTSFDSCIDSLARLASTLTEAVLITGGFHQHNHNMVQVGGARQRFNRKRRTI
jgi:hypothetical protein